MYIGILSNESRICKFYAKEFIETFNDLFEPVTKITTKKILENLKECSKTIWQYLKNHYELDNIIHDKSDNKSIFQVLQESIPEVIAENLNGIRNKQTIRRRATLTPESSSILSFSRPTSLQFEKENKVIEAMSDYSESEDMSDYSRSEEEFKEKKPLFVNKKTDLTEISEEVETNEISPTRVNQFLPKGIFKDVEDSKLLDLKEKIQPESLNKHTSENNKINSNVTTETRDSTAPALIASTFDEKDLEALNKFPENPRLPNNLQAIANFNSQSNEKFSSPLFRKQTKQPCDDFKLEKDPVNVLSTFNKLSPLKDDKLGNKIESSKLIKTWNCEDNDSTEKKKKALVEIKNLFLAIKISYHLSAEKHRDNFIIRDGGYCLLEKYPFISANHSSQLYKLINSESGVPNEVVPNQIWLGNCNHAESKQIINGMGITHVLNITKEVDNFFENEGVTYLKVPVRDYSHSIINVYFKLCYEFIEQYSYGRILIHCVLGRSRSCSIMVMYLMKKYNLSYCRASEVLSEKRQSAQINLGFEAQLLNYEDNNCEFPSDSFTDVKQ